ncbi:MAG: permease-like cell division protein FtsX [Defluviitaleaceae bacterium]|nr:permease-like cell division protein FtsX [Defluviitaleaceae bacterium]
MKIRNLRYFLSESIRSMIRNRLMSLASIITVASCILILAISYFIVTNVNQLMENIGQSMLIIVFVEDEATDHEVDVLESQLVNIPHIVDISFTSEEEAFARAADEWGMEPELLEGLPHIMPRSFSLELDALENQHYVVNYVTGLDSVMHIRHDQEGMDIFIGISRTVSIVSAIVIAFLGGISTVIIINTIKITVSARKNEINIMKYVGATDWFIRWPFLMEGVLIGVLGALTALGASYFIYTYAVVSIVDGVLGAFFAILFFEPRDVGEVFLMLAPICVAMGICIGVAGSATSIRKYLRV